MIVAIAKKAADRLPPSVQESLKRWWYRRKISSGTLTSPEPEFARLAEWIRPGSTAVDVGANIGSYTRRMAEIAGPTGRVIAFEPIPQTFRLLVNNIADFDNITLVNAAVGRENGLAHMAIPLHKGWAHPTRAAMSDAGISVAVLALDGLSVGHVGFIKLDVEGHEFEALQGMRGVLERDHPVLLVEDNDDRVPTFLSSLGYRSARAPESPNVVWTFS